MIDKKLYLQLKRDIRCFCRQNIVKLCDDMELTEMERQLLLDYYDNKSVVQTSMELCISQKTYSRYMRVLFSKIYDYKNTP